MTVVVSDTSPIRALEFLDCLGVLPVLFDRILVPPAVVDELVRTGGPYRLIDVNQYHFLQIVEPRDEGQVDSLLVTLDRGEAEAIVLAREVVADALLIDEADGRRVACQQFGLRVVGSLGILLSAKRHGIVSTLRPLIDELRAGLGFFVSEALYLEVLHKRVNPTNGSVAAQDWRAGCVSFRVRRGPRVHVVLTPGIEW